MTMIVVNIFEAKAKLSEYLDMAAQGERVLICKRNRPVAELHAVQSARTTPRPIGLARGRFVVPPSFFDPLPDDILGGFEGAVQPGAGPAGGFSRRVRRRKRGQ
jgi:prevent-host-death family protein